jgi:hypothetical protein
MALCSLASLAAWSAAAPATVVGGSGCGVDMASAPGQLPAAAAVLLLPGAPTESRWTALL